MSMATQLSPDTCRRAELLCRSHPQHTVAEVLGIAKSTLWHLKSRGWRPIDKRKQFRPMPADFAIQCRYMTSGELRVHYRTSTRAIARWKRELRG